MLFFSISVSAIFHTYGGDPAPFWDNLFLFSHESQWLQKIRKSHNILARKFGNTHKYIDDLVAINDGGAFDKHHKEIYPPHQN